MEFQTREGRARVVRSHWSVGVSWSRGPGWVHVLACNGPAEFAVEAIAEGVPEDQAVRALAVRMLDAAGLGPGTVVDRPPRYLVTGTEAPVTLSLSHDGPWAAVAFARIP